MFWWQQNSAATALRLDSGDLWEFTVDATGLVPGRYYGICIDLDGPVLTMAYGNSGSLVYISGMEGIDPPVLRKAIGQQIQLNCPYCNPVNETTAPYLSINCDVTNNQGFLLPPVQDVSTTVSFLSGIGTLDEDVVFHLLTIEASPLAIGIVYTLCHDLDGRTAMTTMGDTGFRVYVVGTSSVAPIYMQPEVNQTLMFKCPSGCSGDSEAYLAATCDITQRGGEVTAVQGSRTSSVPFDVHASTFCVTFDATGLVVGSHYALCTDLDGHRPCYQLATRALASMLRR